jgi:hypothetical protein
MGSIPYRMCDVCKKKKRRVQSVLGALRQNLSHLRVEKLGCPGSRQVILAALCAADACLSCTCGSSCPGSIYPLRREFVSCPSPRVAGVGPAVVLHHTPSVPPSARSFLRVLRCILLYSLYLPKTAFAALANLQSGVLTLPKALPRGKNFSFTETRPSGTLTDPIYATGCRSVGRADPSQSEGCTLW